MFIIVPFISSTGLAIVAEADLRFGDFLSDKSCRHKFVVSTSFWSWLLNVSSVLTSLKYTATFFGVLVRCGFAEISWSTKISILVFIFLKYVFFLFVLDAIFCGTNFFIFQDIVWLVKSSWCVQYCSIHQFYWFRDRCRSGFALWYFFIRKKLSSQIGSFH